MTCNLIKAVILNFVSNSAFIKMVVVSGCLVDVWSTLVFHIYFGEESEQFEGIFSLGERMIHVFMLIFASL